MSILEEIENMQMESKKELEIMDKKHEEEMRIIREDSAKFFEKVDKDLERSDRAFKEILILDSIILFMMKCSNTIH